MSVTGIEVGWKIRVTRVKACNYTGELHAFIYEVEMGTFISSYWTCNHAMAKQSYQSAAEWMMPTIKQLSVLHNI